MAWACQSCTLLSREREYIIMKKALLFLGMFLFSVVSVHAEDNVLQSIEIVPVKDSYNIVLTADKPVDVKKSVEAQNRVTLNMKGIRASKTLNTVYNNVSNVDTVMVEPNGNGISLFFQAENAAAATVSFDSIAPIAAPVKTQNQRVKLSNPIESYAPIYKEDYKSDKTSNLFKKLTSKADFVSEDVQENVSDLGGKMVSWGLVGLLVFSVVKLFKRREPDMKIGLSQGLNEREIDMFKGASPLGVSYSSLPEKPFTNVNYGINAYQRENRNPYEEEITFHNPRLQNYVSPLVRNQLRQQMQRPAVETASQAQAVATAPVQQPVRKQHTTPVNTAPVNQTNPNIDNLKFLESMTAIYEKSGRHDLAQGLKASLSKNAIK